MNEFDFLSRVPLGQYVETGSPVHRMDARVKVVFFVTLFIALTVSPSWIGLVFGLFFLIIFVFIAKFEIKFVLKSLAAPLPFLLVFAVIQVLINSSASDSHVLLTLWKLHISTSGILAGVILLLRFSDLILTLTLASFCISTSELIQGTQSILSPLNKLRIKTMDFVMVVQITLRFVPLMAQTAERIAKAQASRGVEWGAKKRSLIHQIRQIIPLIVPLFTISLRRADSLALAMDARAYGYLDRRTSMLDLKFKPLDAVFVGLNIIASLVIFFA